MKIVLSVASVVLFACGVGGGSGAAGSSSSQAAASGVGKTESDAKATSSVATTAAKKPTKVAQVGLTADLPEGAMINDGITENSAMISSEDGTVTLKVASKTDPETMQQGKDSALLGDNGKNLKGEKTSDGWVVTWENSGSMGENFWLTMRREIAGKAYLCSTMQSNDAQRKAAIDMCNSLKP